MASSSSKNDSRKSKRIRDTSPSKDNEKHALFDKPQDVWKKCGSGKYETEKTLIDVYNKRIKRLEEKNQSDLRIIIDHQQKIDDRNNEIKETRQKIVDVYKTIENSLYIS